MVLLKNSHSTLRLSSTYFFLQLQSRQSPAVRRRIALIGARALLKMLFVDNFVHGDLHPGNILIRLVVGDKGSHDW